SAAYPLDTCRIHDPAARSPPAERIPRYRLLERNKLRVLAKGQGARRGAIRGGTIWRGPRSRSFGCARILLGRPSSRKSREQPLSVSSRLSMIENANAA